MSVGGNFSEADGNGDDIAEQMPFAAVEAWIFQTQMATPIDWRRGPNSPP
jgi:hypothetical protein